MRCKRHQSALTGEPKFVPLDIDKGVWQYDLSEMYCEADTNPHPDDDSSPCNMSWVVELGKVDFVRRKEI